MTETPMTKVLVIKKKGYGSLMSSGNEDSEGVWCMTEYQS